MAELIRRGLVPRSSVSLTLALSFLWTLMLAALFAEWLVVGPPRLAEHPLWLFDTSLGTDRGLNGFGWWLLATRQVLVAVFVVLCVALPVGCALGALAAQGPAVFRTALTRGVELSGALPSLIIIGLWHVGRPSETLASFIAIVALLKSIETARLVAEETARLKALPHVQAARALGASPFHLFRVHILPDLLPSLAVSAGSAAAFVVGLEGAVSFVGLGPQHVVSWGSLLGKAASGGDVTWPLITVSLASIALTTVSLYEVCRPRAEPS